MSIVLISAHDGFPRWAGAGADYLEVDVRRDRSGTFILAHDEPRAGAPFVTLEAALGGSEGLQLDLKQRGWEVEVVEFALGRRPPERLAVTTGEDESIRIVKERFPEIRAGLTLGERPSASTWDRIARCHADFVALDHRYARWFAQSRLPVWLWTVDGDRLLKRYLGQKWVECVITNRPERALELRKGRS